MASISRHCALIVCNGLLAVLEDIGSKNGTTGGQQAVTTRRELRHGDKITSAASMRSTALLNPACRRELSERNVARRMPRRKNFEPTAVIARRKRHVVVALKEPPTRPRRRNVLVGRSATALI
jgi:hypothetical protein